MDFRSRNPWNILIQREEKKNYENSSPLKKNIKQSLCYRSDNKLY